MVFWKKVWRQRFFVLIVSIDFLYFFLIYDHPKGKKIVMENEKNALFQKYFHQMYDNCCKFSTNVAKNFVNNFLTSSIFGKNL